MSLYVVSVREGPRFNRLRADSAEQLVTVLQQETERISRAANAGTAGALFRSFAPVEQVVGRIDVARRRHLFGRRERAGIDIRGDGSTEAYLGRANRKLIMQLPDETAVGALRRMFIEPSSNPWLTQ